MDPLNPETLAQAIGIGLALNLLSAEVIGLAAGGMVVPGYIALFLDKPWSVVLTLGAALATFLIVRALSSLVIIYGRRRTVLMILVGYLIGTAIRAGEGQYVPYSDQAFTVIGYIIPGLIALWMDRQGLVETVCALFIASVMTRLLLVIFLGVELLP
ncbi:MAG: poly-gamma-glutamate biosynthesis protein PgsC [Acidobacteriota bacterium]|jgi:gamma-polyglutamate biosynthesis protein CapC